MYKVKNNIAPVIVSELFSLSIVPYSKKQLLFPTILYERTTNSVFLRIENLEYGTCGNQKSIIYCFF